MKGGISPACLSPEKLFPLFFPLFPPLHTQSSFICLCVAWSGASSLPRGTVLLLSNTLPASPCACPSNSHPDYNWEILHECQGKLLLCQIGFLFGVGWEGGAVMFQAVMTVQWHTSSETGQQSRYVDLEYLRQALIPALATLTLVFIIAV